MEIKNLSKTQQPEQRATAKCQTWSSTQRENLAIGGGLQLAPNQKMYQFGENGGHIKFFNI